MNRSLGLYGGKDPFAGCVQVISYGRPGDPGYVDVRLPCNASTAELADAVAEVTMRGSLAITGVQTPAGVSVMSNRPLV